MAIVEKGKPLQGDSVEATHAALPAGGLTGELYVTPPTTKPDGSASLSGVVPEDTYTYKYTFAIRNPATDQILGETTPSAVSDNVVVSSGTKQVALTGVLTSSNPHVNARRIYRSNDDATWKLVGIIRDNVTTTFTDNQQSTTSAPSAPSSEGTGQAITANVPTATSSALAVQEAGVENAVFSSKGVLTKGIITPLSPFGFAEVTGYFCRPISSVETLSATHLTAITAIYGPAASSTAGLVINDGSAHTFTSVTVAATARHWKLFNPIFCDLNWTILASASSYVVAGFHFTDNGYLTPVIKDLNSTEYEVPANTVFVLTGVTAAAAYYLMIEEDDNVGSYQQIAVDESLVYDSGAEGRSENVITTPMVFPPGATLYSTGPISLWGYEVPIT